jgi:hypothetical protein
MPPASVFGTLARSAKPQAGPVLACDCVGYSYSPSMMRTVSRVWSFCSAIFKGCVPSCSVSKSLRRPHEGIGQRVRRLPPVDKAGQAIKESGLSDRLIQ